MPTRSGEWPTAGIKLPMRRAPELRTGCDRMGFQAAKARGGGVWESRPQTGCDWLEWVSEASTRTRRGQAIASQRANGK